MSAPEGPDDPGDRGRQVAAAVTGAGVAAAGIAAAVLLPGDFLARGAGRLAIALLGASAGVLAWCLRRAWAAAVRARRDAGTTVAEARGVRRVERLLAQLPDAVVAVDPRGVVCVANTAAGELLGVRPEHVGRPLAEAMPAPSLRELLAPVLAGTAEHGTRDMTDLVPEAVIHVRVSRVQADEDGLLVLICASDATRLRRLERLRHDFVANVSHELRTPITAIKGFVETMLDRRLYRGSNGKRFLRIAGAQAERLDALVEDLLSLSRIEQGEHDGIDATAQPLAPIVTRAVDACRSRLGGGRARIGIAGVDGMRVRANAPLLERALANLLDNALLYGGDRASVRISARSEDGAGSEDGAESGDGARSEGGVRIEVTDDGPGIAGEHLDRVFERFYRVERDSSIPGSGLGLAIVKHIVQAHGGRVSVMSEAGSGTTFTLQIPP